MHMLKTLIHDLGLNQKEDKFWPKIFFPCSCLHKLIRSDVYSVKGA